METISDYYKGLLSGSSLSLHDIQNAVLDRRGKKGGIVNEEDIAFAIWNKITSKYKWV